MHYNFEAHKHCFGALTFILSSYREVCSFPIGSNPFPSRPLLLECGDLKIPVKCMY